MRRLGVERPFVLFGQEAASGIFQASRNAGGILGAASQRLAGGKEVDGGVEPLALPLDLWGERDWLGQVGVGRVADGGQWDYGSVKDDGNGARGLHVLRIRSGDDLGHLQVADSAEAEAVGTVQGVAVTRFGVWPNRDVILRVPLEVAGGLEAHGAFVGPLQIARHLRADLEGSRDRVPVHCPVKGQDDVAIGRQFLAPLRRALHDDRRDGVGWRGSVRGQRRGCGLEAASPQEQTEQRGNRHDFVWNQVSHRIILLTFHVLRFTSV